MARDAGEWKLKPGERVRIRVHNTEGLHADTVTDGWGTFVRHLGDYERFPYEVDMGPRGKFTYAWDEIYETAKS